MLNNIYKFRVLLIGIILILSCCNENLTAPRSTIPLRVSVPRDGYGSFLQVTYKSPQGGIDRFAGEFIGTRNDSLYLLNQDNWLAVNQSDCTEAVLIQFKNNASDIPFAGLGGVVASIAANGFYSLLTGTIWITGTAITTGTEARRANNLIYPRDSWDRILPYSRFPQGVPTNVNINDLTVRADAMYRVREYVTK